MVKYIYERTLKISYILSYERFLEEEKKMKRHQKYTFKAGQAGEI